MHDVSLNSRTVCVVIHASFNHLLGKVAPFCDIVGVTLSLSFPHSSSHDGMRGCEDELDTEWSNWRGIAPVRCRAAASAAEVFLLLDTGDFTPDRRRRANFLAEGTKKGSF